MNITSKIVAFSSAVAFALQIALALLMLRYFSPEEVGMFSVISQIGFFWTTLALAQAPLQLLANHGFSVLDDARHAWVSSLNRFLCLLPVAAIAVWWSSLPFVTTMVWVLLMSLCQLTWMLAQSMHLRMQYVWAQLGVRVSPPLMTLIVATVAFYIQWKGPSLLCAGLLGYATGASWLLPVFLVLWRGKFDKTSATSDEYVRPPSLQVNSQTVIGSARGDNRSTALRMSHTLADALLATTILVVWQRLYGAQEMGWMAAPLRLLGFVPTVIHISWAHVQLTQPTFTRTNILWIGVGGFICVVLLSAACAIAVELGWLGEQWQGVLHYLLPLVLWQGGSCISAACSHLPFLSSKASLYSWLNIFSSCIQALSLLIFSFFNANQFTTPSNHLLFFSLTSFTCSIFTAYFSSRK